MAGTQWAQDDPRIHLAQSPMNGRQLIGIALCVALNALDGFDVLAISFASPGIAASWHVAKAALGFVLTMELFGMALGSVFLGWLADRIGRRATVLGCLVTMLVGMIATSMVRDLGELAVTRVLTGVGIGGMLAATNALTAEYANARSRATSVALMAAGYPLGAVLGGSIVSHLLLHHDWRSIFQLGACAAALLVVPAALLLPEPVGALLRRRGPDTLARVNASLRALGHDEMTALPPEDPTEIATQSGSGFAKLFAPALRATTILLTAAYFLHIITFYFVLKWVPKIVVDMGFSPSSAAGVLVWANVGGLAGSAVFAIAALRFAPRRLLLVTMAGSAVMVAVFGMANTSLANLTMAAGAAGFFTNATIVGLYALVAASFPTRLRGGGTGFVIGAGRGGSAVGPIAAGFLFQAKVALPLVAVIMACGSLLAMAALLALPKRAET